MQSLVQPIARLPWALTATPPDGGGGPTPPPVFDPGAVLFSQDTSFAVNGSLGVTNSSIGTAFMWLRGTAGDTTSADNSLVPVDVMSNHGILSTPDSEHLPGFNNVIDTAGGVQGCMRLNLAGSVTGPGNTFEGTSGSVAFANAVWQGLLYTWDAANTHMAVYRVLPVAGVWTWTPLCQGGAMTATPPLVVDVNNANGFGINPMYAPSAPYPRGLFWTSQPFIDLQNCICDASGVISLANLAKFCTADGPVDIKSAGWLGRTPEVYYEGKAASFTTKLGTHTADLSLMGTRPALYDAPYGPSGRPVGTAAVEWTSQTTMTRSSGLTSGSVSNARNPIKLGQQLFALVQVVDNNTTTTHTFADQNGWTLVASVNWVAGGEAAGVGLFTKTAGAGDVTADGTLKTYSFTWGTANSYGHNVFLWAMEGVSTASPLDAPVVFSNHGTNNGHGNNTGSGLICDSVTTVTDGCTLITLYTMDAWDVNDQVRPPAGSNTIYKCPDGQFHAGPGLLMAWEYLGAAGATGTRTASTITSPVGANLGITLAIRPSGA